MNVAVKRIVHYVLLAAMLLGVPLACCLLSGDEDMLDVLALFLLVAEVHCIFDGIGG